jgi:phosphate starvation-inducible PhoH-like protein
MIRREVHLSSERAARAVCGELDRNLRAIERLAGVKAGARGQILFLDGPAARVREVVRLVEGVEEALVRGRELAPDELEPLLRQVGEGRRPDLPHEGLDESIPAPRKTIHPKGATQRSYLAAMRRHDIVFGIGPAGTGKTYLAMAAAMSALLRKEVGRIILARPAVEAGEKLGFLPGDIAEKINPYLRPLYDALFDMMGSERALKLVEKGVIEIAPLAFMRGRTLNDSFVILDEAQNTTTEQMKMFLTRLGFDSKAVITGDLTQIDLPDRRPSGLVEVVRILEGIEGISFVRFGERDVVRHPLVQLIIRAYEKAGI